MINAASQSGNLVAVDPAWRKHAPLLLVHRADASLVADACFAGHVRSERDVAHAIDDCQLWMQTGFCDTNELQRARAPLARRIAEQVLVWAVQQQEADAFALVDRAAQLQIWLGSAGQENEARRGLAAAQLFYAILRREGRVSYWEGLGLEPYELDGLREFGRRVRGERARFGAMGLARATVGLGVPCAGLAWVAKACE